MIKVLPLAVIVGVCTAGCVKEDPPTTAASAALYVRAESVRWSDSCRRIVPLEAGRSFPLPGLTGGKPLFRVFYFALADAGRPRLHPHTARVRPPAYMAWWAADGGESGCAPWRPDVPPPGDDTGPLLSPEAARLSAREREAERMLLYKSLEKAAVHYFADRRDDRAMAEVRDFLRRFDLLSEPGLAPYYYRLAPNFWDWIERSGAVR